MNTMVAHLTLSVIVIIGLIGLLLLILERRQLPVEVVRVRHRRG